jgi:hypothetical protein
VIVKAADPEVFLKPNLPIKSKQDRLGSLKKSHMLSFDEDL